MKRLTSKSRKTLAAAVTLEALESRQLMSVAPFVVNGTPGNDVISVSYGLNTVLTQATVAQPTVAATTTTKAAVTTAATTKAAVATTTPAATTTTTAAMIITPPTILNRLTVTVDGVTTTTTLATGQSVQINGLDGNDLITVSGKVTTQINGGNGNDTMIGGTGADQFNGGAGIDTVDYSARTTAVSVTLDGVANDGATGEGDNVGADVEVINGGSGNDYLAANATDPTPRTFNGNAGNDTIRGGAGNDSINGGAGNDYLVGNAGNDIIHAGAGDDLVEGSDGDDILYADSGNDYLFGEGGNDHLYTGTSGQTALYGGDGDDILVSIGGSHSDDLYGGAGNNSFWCDAESTEIVHDATPAELATNVHRVAAYDALKVNGVSVGAPSRNIGVGNLPDPGDAIGTTTFAEKNFASKPLFADGVPIEDDVNQGAADDCYFLATLSSIAKVSPSVIEQHIVDLGDGTYAVDFKKGSTDHYIRVDADLPVSSSGGIVYDHFGTTTSMWVPLMEKAWAFFRTGAGTYTSTNFGFPSEAFNVMGMSNDSYMPHNTGFLDLQSESADDFGNHIASLLSSGDSVMVCTPDNSMYLENSHCYTVDHVTKVNGKVTAIILRNPWGTDGKGGNGPNDGYISMTSLDVLESVDLVSYGHK